MYDLLMAETVLGYFLRILPVTLLTGIVYGVIRYVYIRKKKIKTVWKTEAVRVIFVLYITGLVNLILLPTGLWSGFWYYILTGNSDYGYEQLFILNYNLVPVFFRWITGELTPGSWTATMLAVNILMFVPLGFLLPFVFKKIKGWAIVLLAVAIPLSVELFQPIVARSFDTDDIITNFIGIVLGYILAVLFKLAAKVISGKRKNNEEL